MGLRNKRKESEGRALEMIDLGRSSIDIEHEGEMFRLGGELTTGIFFAWLSWIDRLTSEKQTITMSEEEQVRVMHMVMDYWNDNKLQICFIDDNLKEICKTYQEPEPKKTWGEKVKDWFFGNK